MELEEAIQYVADFTGFSDFLGSADIKTIENTIEHDLGISEKDLEKLVRAIENNKSGRLRLKDDVIYSIKDRTMNFSYPGMSENKKFTHILFCIYHMGSVHDEISRIDREFYLKLANFTAQRILYFVFHIDRRGREGLCRHIIDLGLKYMKQVERFEGEPSLKTKFLLSKLYYAYHLCDWADKSSIVDSTSYLDALFKGESNGGLKLERFDYKHFGTAALMHARLIENDSTQFDLYLRRISQALVFFEYAMELGWTGQQIKQDHEEASRRFLSIQNSYFEKAGDALRNATFEKEHLIGLSRITQ